MSESIRRSSSVSREDRIREILNQELTPTSLEIINESHLHRGPHAETHFKVTIVSDKFQSSSSLSRRRRVQDLLRQEFDTGLHALSIQALTTQEWNERDPSLVFETPPCAHRK